MDRFPESLDIESLSPETVQRIVQSESKGGQLHQRRGLAHGLLVTIGLSSATNMAERAQALWFLETHQAQRFELVVPMESDPKGSAPNGAAVATNAAKGARQIALSGYAANDANAVAVRDPILFQSHAKVYRLGPAQSNGSGQVVCDIHPPLRQNVVAGEVVTLSNVPFTGRLVPGTIDADISGHLNPLSFEFREDA
ncbi:hypothetical protein [Ferrimonas aestuarii]|uniref:Uncharacterized protein n=1 Tax=Ferrimonas aestuarii TaxID=2569539 RepID=A0A4U1BLA6_9GAMM|nr:hypothetical protein [Ferrimonas aestuarii]TKB53308.1 hypothetical protein FCL42_14660 [Ferrimonas aestuarii]